LIAEPNSVIPLGVSVVPGAPAAFIATLAKRYDRPAVDSKLFLRQLRPWLSKERAGLKLDQRQATRDVASAVAGGVRTGITLTQSKVRPKLTRATFGPVIVIRRSSNQLFLYDGMRYRRLFGVATGQHQYPTPLGRFSIVVKWKNPWWYPPSSPWAQGQKPIPPGPGNPLGTRWMGLSAPGVGIHGTPSDGSIGYSVSHGCIRMHIPQAEWLFNHVEIGTTVFIVAS
jgi:lipoprotein-anchoring transpeptidase ErfK/SrfK